MRSLWLLTALALAPGCSLTDVGGADAGVGAYAYRTVAQAGVGQPPRTVTVLRSQAEADAFQDEVQIAVAIEADFETETVVAVATSAACPATNYVLDVTDVTPDGSGVLVDAEVRRSGDVGGAALTYPLTFVGITDLPTTQVGDRPESRVVLRVADPTGACSLR